MSHLGYTSYVLTPANRAALAARFPPKYDKFVGHHITYEFGAPENAEAPPTPKTIKVIGYIDSGDGIEALVVSVDGSTDRPDGRTFHITWSLQPEVYSAKHSNELLKSKRYTLVLPQLIDVTPLGNITAIEVK